VTTLPAPMIASSPGGERGDSTLRRRAHRTARLRNPWAWTFETTSRAPRPSSSAFTRSTPAASLGASGGGPLSLGCRSRRPPRPRRSTTTTAGRWSCGARPASSRASACD